MTDPNPKRAAERVDVGQVTGAVTVFQPMTILNISVKGMLMESGASLHNDSLHDFRLSLDGRSIVAKGRVVYCKIGELREGTVVLSGCVPSFYLKQVAQCVVARCLQGGATIDNRVEVIATD